MNREYIKQLIRQGFHVIEYGQPKKVEGDLLYHLDKIDEEDSGILVLEDIIAWTDEELASLKINSYFS